MLRQTLIAAFTYLCLSHIGDASTTLEPPLDNDRLLIQQYMTNTLSIKANIAQHSTDGNHTAGTFYMARPGRFRLDYDYSPHLSLICDGSQVAIHDRETGSIYIDQIEPSVVSFLISPIDDITSELRLARVERQGDDLYLTLRSTLSSSGNVLTLVFGTAPFELKKWIVLEHSGIVIVVKLLNIQKNIVIESRLFSFDHLMQQKHE